MQNYWQKKIKQHNVTAWLVNTGWTGGAYGEGSRIKLKYTRAMIDAIHNKDFDHSEFVVDEAFGFQIPTRCPNVPSEVLIPKNTWHNKEKYEVVKGRLIALFNENFKQFEDDVSQAIVTAGPNNYELQS